MPKGAVGAARCGNGYTCVGSAFSAASAGLGSKYAKPLVAASAAMSALYAATVSLTAACSAASSTKTLPTGANGAGSASHTISGGWVCARIAPASWKLMSDVVFGGHVVGSSTVVVPAAASNAPFTVGS